MSLQHGLERAPSVCYDGFVHCKIELKKEEQCNVHLSCWAANATGFLI